jgi:hypothetical protein
MFNVAASVLLPCLKATLLIFGASVDAPVTGPTVGDPGSVPGMPEAKIYILISSSEVVPVKKVYFTTIRYVVFLAYVVVDHDSGFVAIVPLAIPI